MRASVTGWWSRLRRPWRRALLCLGGLVGLWGLVFLATSDGSVNIAVDYLKRVQEMNPVGPEEERSWPLIREAKQKVGEERLTLLRQAAGRARIGFKIYPEIDEIDLAAVAGQGGVVMSPRGSDLMKGSLVEGIDRGHPMVMSTACEDLAADIKVAVAAGDVSRAIDDAVAIIGLANQLATPGSTLLQQMLGIINFTRAAEGIAREVAAHPGAFSDADLSRLAASLGAIDPEKFSIDFTTERFFTDDLLQRLYTDDGNGDGSLSLEASIDLNGGGLISRSGPVPRWVAAIAAPFHCMVAASRAEISQYCDPFWDALQAEADSLPWLTDRTVLDGIRADMSGASSLKRWRIGPFAWLVPGIRSAADDCKSSESAVAAARMSVAAEQFRRATGRWPESIEELKDRLGGDLPLDPCTGTPLRLQVIDGALRIWSLGEDRTDEGGRPALVGRSGRAKHDRPFVGSYFGGTFQKGEPATDPAPAPELVNGWWVIPNQKSASPFRGDWVLWPHDPPALSPSPDPTTDSPAAAPSP